MLYKAQSVLSKESTQYVQKFTPFLKLLKLLQEQVSFLSNLTPAIAQLPKYISKATACTLYAIS